MLLPVCPIRERGFHCDAIDGWSGRGGDYDFSHELASFPHASLTVVLGIFWLCTFGSSISVVLLSAQV